MNITITFILSLGFVWWLRGIIAKNEKQKLINELYARILGLCESDNSLPEVNDITSLPDDIGEMLYNLRLPTDVSTMKEDYLKRYEFIVVDKTIYVADDKHTKKMLSEYLKANIEVSNRVTIPHAIIQNGIVFKNRYGNKSQQLREV